MSRNSPEISRSRKKGNHWYVPLKVAGLYALIAGVWIVFSDRVLLWGFISAEQLTQLQTLKGWFFVAATALLLAWLVRRNLVDLQTEVDSCQMTQASFRTLVETIPHGIQECDTKGTITFTNTGYDRIFGYEPGEAIGTTIWEKILREEDRRQLQEYLSLLVVNQPSPTPYISHSRTMDEREIYVQIDWDYLRDEAGEILGFASVITDITERKQAEEAILASDRLKSELITTAAHEFRTPLTTIQGFSELLLGNHDFSPDEQQEYLDIIHRKSLGLTDMVENLLDLSRLEAGLPMPMKVVSCTVAELTADVAPFMNILGADHRVEVVLADEKTRVHVDREKIVQVLENLLSNGAKYSRAGSLLMLRGESVGERYRFEVSDQGVGMSAIQQARIFERFYRADYSDSSPSGLGIGMAIVKQIVEAHGGLVQVESAPGQGTRVSFDLPLA